jgi:DNA-binding CsgD family transcriptional regulator
MTRTMLVWAAILAVAAFVLQWLEFQHRVRMIPAEIYISLIGTTFAAGGVWVGWRLSSKRASEPFAMNRAAQQSLGLTGQEMKVLEQLALGLSNKEMARSLGLSPNTIKTHIANLYAKLEVGRRTQAISKARDLRLLP